MKDRIAVSRNYYFRERALLARRRTPICGNENVKHRIKIVSFVTRNGG